MKIGFYQHTNTLNKQIKKHLIYVYQIDPMEAVDVITGELSSYYDLEKFEYLGDTQELKDKFDWLKGWIYDR